MLNDSYSKELQDRARCTFSRQHCCADLSRSGLPSQKEIGGPVTIADFGSQALVCRALREAFPDDPIIAEEDSTLLRADAQTELREILGQHLEVIRPGTSLKSTTEMD